MTKSGMNQKKAAKEFADFWKNKGDERQETARFWIGLLEKVLGMGNPAERIEFEKKVQLKHTSFIDAYIPETKVLIEQKSVDVDLRKEAKQSDGAMLTPYRQAKRYADEMPNSLRPDWIIVCNFREFLIYDMEKPHDEPVQVLLEDLPDKFECLQFMIDSQKTSVSPEEQISLKAGELVGKLYDALYKEYIEPDENSLRSLNILCVRIVFCLYAEDAGLFETRTAFEDYIKSFNLPNLRDGIIKLFKALDTKLENRDKYDSTLNSFPYVNGGLFADDNIEIPNFTKEIVDVIVNYCAPFDWSEISPTIFGAVFESTLNPETRRKDGMHYTSIKNIHKVIDPLFMDDLKAEFAKIVKTCRGVSLKTKLEDFRNKLAGLRFLDPACGSGNFLTETYISLRRLENESLKVIHGSQMLLSSKDFSPIKVRISQFYGIEINDFAVTVAKTALWIAESQMMKETEEIVEQNLDFLPLSTSATIVEGNALRMDWTTLETETKNDFVFADRLNVYKINEKSGVNMVCEPEVPYNAHYTELNVVTPEITERKFPEKDDKKSLVYDYIIGNPPFVGARFMDKRQKEDVISTFGKNWHGAGDLDYVCCWYKKALETIKGSDTRCAFVSTNSVTQGTSVANLWKPLFADGLHFDFAWRTFKWANETPDKKNMAAVHCVVIGFSIAEKTKPKIIFENEHEKIEAKNINGYLLDLPDIFVESRSKPICNVPLMNKGNQPTDGGNLIISAEEYDDFIKKEPHAQKFIHEFLGAEEFINGIKRYCLWLTNATPAELRKMPLVMKRVEAVKTMRSSSKKEATRNWAAYPYLFTENRQPESGSYLLIPSVSSEKRSYIPIGFLSAETIASNLVLIIPNATLYEFGIMTSSVHNAWMRSVCGRLESRYRYSASLVYNNFPWCDPTDAKKAKIEQTAQAILDARAKYPDSSLADLYDKTTMPPELRKAHKENDKAVMQAYGFNLKMGESEIVAELFKMYEKLTKKKG
ncbi:methylase [bacterium]|nr:methylase [bacterium]